MMHLSGISNLEEEEGTNASVSDMEMETLRPRAGCGEGETSSSSISDSSDVLIDYTDANTQPHASTRLRTQAITRSRGSSMEHAGCRRRR